MQHWCEWFRQAAAPECNPTDFARQMDWMAVQRQLKAIGIFVRLRLRDQKRSHLQYVLPTLSQVQEIASRYAELAPLAHWLRTQEPLVRDRLRALQASSAIP